METIYSPFLVARGDSFHSPPLLTLFTGASVSTGVELTLTEIKSVLGRWLRKRREHRELYERLFGFTRSAEFVGSIRASSSKVLSSDIKAFVDFMEVIPFEKSPELKMEEKTPEPVMNGNLCFFGTGPYNELLGFMEGYVPAVKEMDKGLVPTLPYDMNFNFDPRTHGKSLDEIRELTLESEPPLNFSIRREGVDAYLPEYDPASKTYRVDYLMLTKVRSLHHQGRAIYGAWNLLIAGCHELGTEALRLVLEDESILRGIWDKAENKGFQAILEALVDVEAKRPRDVRLLGVEPL